MIETVYQSDNLASADRFDQWCEVTGRNLVPTHISTERPERFHARMRVLDLGRVWLTDLRYPELTCVRTPVHIRRSDPELYQLSLTLRGATTMQRDRQQDTAPAGDMLLYGTWHPYAGYTRSQHGAVAHLLLHIPRAALPLPHRQVDRLLGHRLPANTGTGTILARLLTDALVSGAHLQPGEATHLGDAALHLTAAFLARHIDAEDVLPAEIRHSVLTARIRAFIDRNLADPDLSPPTIAAAHHVSVRYLHLLFHQQGSTVSGWIRQQRLERCRRDLTEPKYATSSIQVIAGRWGLTRPAHFSRAFRAAYGMSPSDYRRAAR